MASQPAVMMNLIDKERERVDKNLSGLLKNDANNFYVPSPKEALELPEESLSLGQTMDPNKAYMKGSAGFILLWMNRPEDAVEHFQKALRLPSFHRNYYFVGLGNAYMDMGRYKEAINAYKRAAGCDPKDLFAHVGLAAACALLDCYKEANAEVIAILKICPKFSIEYFAQSMPFKSQVNREFWTEALQKAGVPE